MSAPVVLRRFDPPSDPHRTKPVALAEIAREMIALAGSIPGPVGDEIFADALRIQARVPGRCTGK